MNERNSRSRRNQPSSSSRGNSNFGRRNDYDKGYDSENYGRNYSDADQITGSSYEPSSASQYPEYMDQENSFNSQSRAPRARNDFSSPTQSRNDFDRGSRFDHQPNQFRDYDGQNYDRQAQQYDYSRQSQSQSQSGRQSPMQEWSPANGTDYRPRQQMDRGYDQYSSNNDQQGYNQRSMNRQDNQYYGQGMNDRAQYDRSNYQGENWASNYGSNGQENQKSHSGTGPKGYKRSDDRIKEDVNDALTHDHHVDASEIEVSVESGVVTLKGTVTERRMKRLAEDCAEHVRGVSDVRNELRVQNDSDKKTWSDSMDKSVDKSADKSDSDATTSKSGKSSRTSTESRNFQA